MENARQQEIKELQLHLLDMWKILKDILDKNKINYFAIGGTAIGTLREKGFIKWDDDLDIALEYKDIPKLEKAVMDDGRLSFDSEYSKKNPFFFTKIFNKNVIISENGEKSHLFIDIFFAIKRRKFKNRVWKRYRLYEKILFAKARKWSSNRLFDSIGFKIAQLFLLPIPFNLLKKKVNKMILRSPIDDENNVRYAYQDYQNEFYNISEIKEYKFEDSKMKVNVSFPEDQKQFYGDIYKKPDHKDRWNHGIKIISVNK